VRCSFKLGSVKKRSELPVPVRERGTGGGHHHQLSLRQRACLAQEKYIAEPVSGDSFTHLNWPKVGLYAHRSMIR
jgi:hypothetical protein